MNSHEKISAKCPGCGKIHSVDAEFEGRHGRCDACGEKFPIVAYTSVIAVDELSEQSEIKKGVGVASTPASQSFPVKTKKSNAGVVATAVIVAVGVGGFATYKYSGLFDQKPTQSVANAKDDDFASQKKSGELTVQTGEATLGVNGQKNSIGAANSLHNITNRSIFDPSPVQVENQWQYGRVARTYANDAGMYPLLAGNAEIASSSSAATLIYDLDKDLTINWTQSSDKLIWKIGEAVRSTTYNVYAYYGADNACSGNTFSIKVGDQVLNHQFATTGGYGNIHQRLVGQVTLTKGEAETVEMVATKINSGTGLLDLRGVEIVPQKTAQRWFNVVNGQWTREIPKSLRFNGTMGDPAPPAQLIKGGPKGYAIITTNAIRDKSKKLATFVEHKKALGYNMMVITEDDFGGGKGPDACDNIRKWLHDNYKKKELLYVLFIGNPHPTHGEIPMPPAATNVKEMRTQIAAGEHPHARRPSDSLYMDCSGHTMDLNGDGTYAGHGDYDATKGGLDTVWDVLVGRISYYGEESAWGKVADVDAILQKTINYENATPEEIYERYNFEIDGFSLDGHVTEWGGFNYVTREQPHRGRLTLDHFSWQNNGFMDKWNIGFIRSGGHASPTWIESGVSSGWLANRTAPKDTLNVVAVYGGCDCSQPEHPMNMGYMHLRKGAIVTAGASRSIAGVGGSGAPVRPQVFFSDIRTTPLKRGYSVGQTHWQNLANGRRMPNGGAHLWTLYGDPSIVPFPEKLNPTRDYALRPVHGLEHHESIYADNSTAFKEQEYDLQNLSKKTQKWSVSIEEDWVDIEGTTSGTLQPGEIATVKMKFNSKSRELPLGRSIAKLNFKLGDKKTVREYHLNRTIPKLSHQFTFDDKGNKAFIPTRDGELTVFDRFDVNEFQNRTISFEIAPQAELGANTRIIEGNMNLKVNADQTLELTWNAYPYGEQNWNRTFLDVTEYLAPVKLKSFGKLKMKSRNTVAIVTNFETDTVTLYLNGRKQTSASMQSCLLLPWKSKIPKNLNAAIDNFHVLSLAYTDAQVANLHKVGHIPLEPTPKMTEIGLNRAVEFAWKMPSSNAKTETTYNIYLGESADQLKLVSSSDKMSYKPADALKPSLRHFWRVDAVSTIDGAESVRQGDVWEFTTGKNISYEVIKYPRFADQDKWQTSGRGIGREGAVAAFKTNGNNIEQEVSPRFLKKGAYKLTLTANCGENKVTRPMWFVLHGQDASGQQTEFHREKVELNDLIEGKVDTFFELKQSLTSAKSVKARIELPGNGGRCPYWVFATEMQLLNNVDLSSLPNRRPKFTEKFVTLPNMPYKDNSYAYEFLPLVKDEDLKGCTFKMLSGPKWVTVQQGGRVFSYYGAPKDAVGEHKMEVQVIDAEGLTDTLTATLKVIKPGEMTLPASESTLRGNQIQKQGNVITHYLDDNDTVSWNFTPAVTGRYNVTLVGGSPNTNIGKVTINGVTKEFTINATGGYGNYKDIPMGEFELNKGKSSRLTIGVVRRQGGLANITAVKLVPITKE